MFNYGLGVASVAGVVSLAWLVVVGRGSSDLLNAKQRGSGPAETFARAEVAALQARADESLTLIDNTGDDSYQKDFYAEQTQLSSELSRASTQSAADGAGQITAAGHAATAWFAVTSAPSSWTPRKTTARRPSWKSGGPGTAGTLFSQLESDLEAAINTSQAVFASNAAAGSDAFSGLRGRHHRARRW